MLELLMSLTCAFTMRNSCIAGSGLELPKSAKEILAQNQQQLESATVTGPAIPPIATQCFMLSNMFDPSQETGETWADEVRDDVIEECAKNGGVLHIFVDKASPNGNVYVKCPSVAAAFKSVNALHGRWFSGFYQSYSFLQWNESFIYLLYSYYLLLLLLLLH
ncbi:unnamed protein product [Brugia timori]|uniref:RBM39linker domain-containing protein n=1 Tax=Brugia timori TaxID=42155 RepID=A0A0R3QJ52_9BILA|nr:unnamed protein product [Brugia timori]